MRLRPLALLLCLTACSAGTKLAKAPAPTPTTKPLVYVAVGASETVGFGADDPLTQAWPQLVFHALPASTTFTNLGIPGETVGGALTDELPQAEALHPDLVTVWLNVNDALKQVPVKTYEEQLDRLLMGLRAGGRTQVVIANTPRLDLLPAYLACRPPIQSDCQIDDPQRLPDAAGVQQIVASFNQAIARVAVKDGAIVVDLHTLSTATPTAKLTGKDGFHPSTLGHQLIGAAFTAVIKPLPLP